MKPHFLLSLAAALCLIGCSKPAAPVEAPKSDMTATASGLRYSVISKGSGTVFPTAADTVTVNYKGTLMDGTVFDSASKASFPLGQVIKGWTEGLQLMHVGDKYKFEIPPDLAYGASSPSPKIPANSTLVFEVELVRIN